jgi:hypothetical protein
MLEALVEVAITEEKAFTEVDGLTYSALDQNNLDKFSTDHCRMLTQSEIQRRLIDPDLSGNDKLMLEKLIRVSVRLRERALLGRRSYHSGSARR